MLNMSNIASDIRIIKTTMVEAISAVGILGTESVRDMVVIIVGRMLDTGTIWDVTVVVVVGRRMLSSTCNEQLLPFEYTIYCTLILLCAQSGGSLTHIKSRKEHGLEIYPYGDGDNGSLLTTIWHQ